MSHSDEERPSIVRWHSEAIEGLREGYRKEGKAKFLNPETQAKMNAEILHHDNLTIIALLEKLVDIVRPK